MSTISRLSESTTRLLGSSLVIITPVTLVKELLDNSIDAKATSIEILISKDTVKKIEVRDNGVGIHPDDYDALGRRSHTSKLRSYDDLKTQSGKTLGFRGEALASVNNFANVTITTKIASEPVAAILNIVPETGGVSKQRPTSAPVGTTVSIAELFGRLPVREQLAVKGSAKTIDMIRELLRSYAMARPHLRLSFKILQLPKQGWSYSPKQGASVREAAIQLFNTELANQCVEKTTEIGGPVDDDTSGRHQPLPNDSYVFEAFVPKPGSDPSKIPKHRYISIDGRPITAKRGTIKKLLGIYNEHLSTAFRSQSLAAIPKDCFIRLNIKCPPGSYDANIEPSKDQILFSDEQTILNGFKDLCKEVYGEPAIETPGSRLESEISILPENRDDLEAQEVRPPKPQAESKESKNTRARSKTPFQKTRSQAVSEPGLASQSLDQQAPAAGPAQTRPLQEISQNISDPSSSAFTPINALVLPSQNTHIPTRVASIEDGSSGGNPNQWHVDMSTDYNEHCYDNRRRKQQPIPASLDHQEKPNAMESSALQDVNPWMIAKMNAPRARRVTEDPSSQENSAMLTFEPPMTPDPPILRHAGAAPGDLDVPSSLQRFQVQGNSYQPRHTLPGGPYRSPLSSPQVMTTSPSIPPTLKPRSRHNLPPWTPPSSVPRAAAYSERLGECNPPASDSMRQTTISFGGTGGGRRKHRMEHNGDNIQQEYSGEERVAEDLRQVFGRRNPKRQLSQQKGTSRQELAHHGLGSQEIPLDHSHTRSRAAQDHVEGPSTSKIKEPVQTTLPADDPRTYLLRRQRSMAAEEKGTGPKKIRRLKSSLLPLEKIPVGNEVHFLSIIEVVNIEALHIYARQIAMYDIYAEKGSNDSGLEMTLSEGREIEARLKAMLRKQLVEASGAEAEAEINLGSLLKGKGVVAKAK
ncbi:hypothetical protein F4821DRAFT_274271 [Hypoxylon rubiginosum]|uniref:Uncharacterized protein n=1 Tax=Hypoxylon rubiginosum TaxID=110542 RepID=A0ACC0DNA6_9PEZI|nr:hypothetical protein F4821DRAFT_274271 [Hypoxylon rubiginosum]